MSGRDGSLETFRYGAGRLPIGRTRRDGSTEEYAWDSQGRLAVEVAEEASLDNTLPITAAAVQTTLGNIGVLLKTM